MMTGLGIGASAACSASADKAPQHVELEVMTGFPTDEQGYERGVSGCYAGRLGNYLLLAGGCNFPDKPVAEGGTKRFYKGIYATRVDESATLEWRKVGELPAEAAYGIAVSLPDRWVLVGGSNLSGRFSSVLSFSWSGAEGSELVCEEWTALPCELDNMSGALLNDTLYVIGGLRNEGASSSLFSLRLADVAAGWSEVTYPGEPRVQPVCAALKGSLYVFGGFATYSDGTEATVSTDGLCYHPDTENWEAVAGPQTEEGAPITLSGGIAVAYADSLLLGTGGVNREIFLDAISGRYQLVSKADYLLKPVEWYRFNDRLLAYDASSGGWSQWGDRSPLLARAGAALVPFGKRLFYIGGELKPGIRTPEICRISFDR